MRHPTIASLAAAALSTAFFCASAGAAPVYLKNGATGACDGSSWANAYTNVAVAIRAAEAGDGLLYVAKGVYVFTNTFTIASPLSIYGGFAGESMGETPATRDTAANQTVFSGDRTGNDYWVHYEPDATGFSVTTRNLTDRKIIGPDGVNLPPDFEGDYDGYWPGIQGSGQSANTAWAFDFGASATTTLDGLTFACFQCKAGVNVPTVTVRSVGSVVNDCTFIAGYVSGSLYFTVVPDATGPTATNCRFLFCRGFGSASMGAGISAYRGPTIVSNCTFLCVSKTTPAVGNTLYTGYTGGLVVRNCEFVRCLMATGASHDNRWGGAGNILSGGDYASSQSFADCVVSNCYTATSHEKPIPLFTRAASNLAFARCLFANNKSVCNASEGKCHPMFGEAWYSSAKHLSFEGCAFASNVLKAASVSAEGGSYVLALIGNYNPRTDASLLNCSFDGNRCETVEKAGVTPIFCRGVACASYSSAKNQAGLANCTFTGPADGTYDIVQYGSMHTEPINVVNCVFTADGDTQPDPVYADIPALVHLYSCTVQNRFLETGGLAYDGLRFDKVPLARAAVGAGPLYALAAAARTPGIRDTCDVATNNVTGTSLASWNFRLPEAGASWQALAPATVALSGSGFDAKLVGDALGAARPAGAFTRGPVQTLAAPAETGATLVLRRDPYGASAFAGEAVQAVAAGAAPAPVTAAPNDPAVFAFSGWYDENGDLYSDSATLSIPSLAAGTTVLTARFSSTVPVTLTFSLGGHGTFASTGTDTATVEAEAFAAFPAVPAFTIDDGWFFAGFTLPDTVPETDTTYAARIVTKDLRIIHVVPAAEAPAVQDGLTWETAYTDLAAAYADAATWRGEVWLKEGIYLRHGPIQMQSNVAVRGGFAGTETDASEADPEAHPAILTGDVSGNGYWYGNNDSNYNRGPIWTGTTFNSPTPSDAEWCWSPRGNYSDDTLNAFLRVDGVATNCVFDGLTFTCFREESINASSGATDGLVVSRCRFLGTTTITGNTSSISTILVSDSPALFTNCLFNGCWHGIRLTGSPAAPTVIVDCVFTNVSGTYSAGGVNAYGKHATDIRRCGFYRNGCNSYNGYASALSLDPSTSTSHTVSDCVFADNYSSGSCHGAVSVNGGLVTLARCRFTGNRHSHSNSNSGRGFAAGAVATYGWLVLRDCHFSGNYASDVADSTLPIASVAATAGSGRIVLANCTVETNAVTVNSSAGGATFMVENTSEGQGIVLVNTLVDASSIAGTGTSEFLCTSANPTVALVNSVVRNEGAGYTPFHFTSDSFQPTIASSVISGYDPADIPAPGANGYLYDVVSATAAVGPLREGENGAHARGVSGPAYAKLGRPVWLVGTTPYIYDDVANPAKPWRSLLSRSSYAASVSGLTLDTPPLPDALGAARKSRYCAPGPLNGAPLQTVIMLK